MRIVFFWPTEFLEKYKLIKKFPAKVWKFCLTNLIVLFLYLVFVFVMFLRIFGTFAKKINVKKSKVWYILTHPTVQQGAAQAAGHGGADTAAGWAILFILLLLTQWRDLLQAGILSIYSIVKKTRKLKCWKGQQNKISFGEMIFKLLLFPSFPKSYLIIFRKTLF